jgi:hypothetical protein
MEIIHWFSIFLEGLICLMGLRLVSKKKNFGWGIFITFGIYVFYDLSKYLNLRIGPDLLYLLFFIASISAFIFVWQLSKKK